MLLTTRLLVTANSGAGKSYLLRKLMEELFGHVQVICIDPEGEFATLREAHGYALVGPGGEIPADVRIAADVAEKLLELRISAVCDLYEMKPAERHEWVAKFLFALVNAPKKLWHPAIIIVDEAQMFCPEKGAGESVASEQMEELTGKGRKRGYCAVWATQKLSNLRKSATTNMLNRLVGGTFEDVDVKRALDLLGVLPEDKAEVKQQLRTLEPGWFYAFGRAVAKERLLFKVGKVETSHPQPGSAKHAKEPPPAPEKVKAVLAKLAEIPHEAEKKAQTVSELKKQITEERNKRVAAERELKRAVLRTATAAAPQKLSKPVVDQAAIERTVQKAVKARDVEWLRSVRDMQRDLDARLSAATKALMNEAHKVGIEAPAMPAAAPMMAPAELVKAPGTVDAVPRRIERPGQFARDAASRELAKKVDREVMTIAGNNGDLAPAKLRVLGTLASWEAMGRATIPKRTLAALLGVTAGSGGFTNNLGALRSAGLIDYPRSGLVALTDAGREAAPAGEEAPASSEEMLRRCKQVAGASKGRILEELSARYPNAMEKAELAELLGVTPGSGGFTNSLGWLRTAGMIDYPAPGRVKLEPWVMLEDEAA